MGEFNRNRRNTMKSSDPSTIAPSETKSLDAPSETHDSGWNRAVHRRSFLRGVGMAGVAVLPGSALWAAQASASSDDLTDGDTAILQFLAAAELIESDLWAQYTE